MALSPGWRLLRCSFFTSMLFWIFSFVVWDSLYFSANLRTRRHKHSVTQSKQSVALLNKLQHWLYSFVCHVFIQVSADEFVIVLYKRDPINTNTTRQCRHTTWMSRDPLDKNVKRLKENGNDMRISHNTASEDKNHGWIHTGEATEQPVLPLPLLQLPVQPGQSQLVGVLLGEEGPGYLLRGLLVKLSLTHQVNLLVLRPGSRATWCSVSDNFINTEGNRSLLQE